MPVTRFNDAALALLAAYRAASLSGAVVYDTAQPMTASDADFVIVGHDGSLEADGTLNPAPTGGTFTQADLEMTAIAQETGFVNCLIVCQSGDSGDAAGRRQRASDLLGVLEDAAAVNGGRPASAPGLMFDGTASGRWIPRQSTGGVAVLLAYQVSYSTEWA
jgi:hypothetical protein